MILFFGSQDKWLEGGRELARRSAALGNRAGLYVAPGVGHGFFHDSRSAKNGVPGWLGYLAGSPHRPARL